MSNICLNTLILSGDRNELMSLISSGQLSYKKNKIYTLNKLLILGFTSDWTPPVEEIKKLSLKHKKIYFQILYIEKLMSISGIYRIRNGKINHQKYDLPEGFERFENDSSLPLPDLEGDWSLL